MAGMSHKSGVGGGGGGGGACFGPGLGEWPVSHNCQILEGRDPLRCSRSDS